MIPSEAVALLLEADPDYRVLRRYRQPERYCDDDGSRKYIGVAIDTETTGLATNSKIIELALTVFEFSSDGRVYRILETASWLEDPGEPLSPEVARVTGLTDDMVRGQRIDDEAVLRVIASAQLLAAHNAAFDRPKVEARFPTLPVRPWACTATEIDWRGEEVESSKLSYIAYRLGFFFDAHRALGDTLALLHAMTRPLPSSGDVALSALLASARAVTARVWAIGSPFDTKAALKSRGYRWLDDPDLGVKCWYRDVPESQADVELEWLRTSQRTPRAAAARLTATTRFTLAASRPPAA